MPADFGNPDVVILGVVVEEAGIQVQVEFPDDERQHLMRGHMFAVAYDSERFGHQAKEVVKALEDLAFEVNAEYNQIPRPAPDDDV